MNFSPGSLTVNGTATGYLTLLLSSGAPAGGLTVNLSSSNTGVATVSATAVFAAGSTSASVPVTGVTAGTVTITASNASYGNATAIVTVSSTTTQPPPSSSISVPASTAVAVGQSVQFPVRLASAAGSGGVFVTLTCSDTSKATVTANVYFQQGSTTPVVDATVNGISSGTVTVTATAFGYPTAASGQVQVGSGGPVSTTTLSFTPTSFAIFGTATLSPSVVVSVPASAGGLTVNLTSSNPAIAYVPPSVIVPASMTTTTVPVTGVGTGTAVITASVGGSSATTSVTVTQQSAIRVTWYGACWMSGTAYGVTGNFQAMDYLLSTPGPVPVQGTLFFAADCDPINGGDNMNDYDDLTGSTHIWEGFSHFPNKVPTSAMYWVGYRTVDGRCPAGSLCSGCVNYTTSTPSCSSLP